MEHPHFNKIDQGTRHFVYLITFMIYLTSCKSPQLKTNGVYVHQFKGGNNRKVTILNDTLIRYQNNVSMMYLDIQIPCKMIKNIILVSQELKDTLYGITELSYPPEKIKILNSRTLKIDNLKFKFKEKDTNKI